MFFVLFYNVYKEKMFKIEIEDGREARSARKICANNFFPKFVQSGCFCYRLSKQL